MPTTSALLRDGIAVARSGNREGARRIFLEAISVEPSNLTAWLWLAGVATEPEHAVRALERALEIDPTNQQARAGLNGCRYEAGVAAAKADRRDEARDFLRQVCSQDPANEAGWLWLAGVTDDPKEAITHLRQAIRINPANERARAGIDYFQTLARAKYWSCPICQATAETKTSTCPTCRAVLELSQADSAIENPYADSEKIRAGAGRLAKLLQTKPDFETHHALGMALLNLSRPDEAVVQFRAASKLRPADTALAAHLAMLERAIIDASAPPPPTPGRCPQTLRVPAPDTPTKCILVVDDSPTIRKLVGLVMRRDGYRVIEAGDGAEALELLQEAGKPDLMLLDINMPGMDGYTVCKQVRQNAATASIPVIMLSGRDGFFDKIRGRMAGSDQYLTKPFQPDVLVKVIREYCPLDSAVAAATAT